MARSKEADVARLYHRHSYNTRARPLEPSLDNDQKPLRSRSYPGHPRVCLPGGDFAIEMPLGTVLERRRSVRDFAKVPLPLETLGRLLYTSYGVTSRRRIEGGVLYERPSPSAGALYPVELYVATVAVTELKDGVYHYDAGAHELELVREGATQDTFVDLTLGQEMVRNANIVLIITAIPERTMFKYGQRGYRYVLFDAGHLAENLYLVSTALGLGPVTIGGFLDGEVNALLGLPEGEEAIYLGCIGQPLSCGA